MDQPRVERSRAKSSSERGRRWVLGVVGLLVAVIVYFIAAAVIPRWWAQRVADVVDGRLTVGALFGLFVGLVFTIVPLGLAYGIVRFRTQRRTWAGWLGWLGLVVLTAAPNLMTLGIVLGGSNAAHAGVRILDVDGPGFRVWSLIGAVAAFAAGGGIAYLARTRRRSRREASELRDQLRAREQG